MTTSKDLYDEIVKGCSFENVAPISEEERELKALHYNDNFVYGELSY